MWQENKAWADRFMPEVKRILGEHLIGGAPYEEDRDHNTDLIVLRLDPVRIACRIRRHKYLAQYANEFTIRAHTRYSTKTELAKIIEGWGDYMFYGFADDADRALAAWTLINLRPFRLWLATETCRRHGQLPGTERANSDGSSTLRAFRLAELPDDAIVARQRPRASSV